MNNRLEQLGRRAANVVLRAGSAGLLVATMVGCEPQNSPVAPTAIVRPLDVTPSRVALGPTAPTPEAQSPWLAELQTNRNRELSISLVRKIASDMVSLQKYPSIVASGQILLDQYDDPQKVMALMPFSLTNNPFPMFVGFTNLDSDVRAMFDVTSNTFPQDIIVNNKSDGKEIRITGQKINTHKYDILLNNDVLNIAPSSWAYRLLLAKETSHLLYVRRQVDDVWNAVGQRYIIRGGDEVKSILWQTSMLKNDPRLAIPNLVPHFDRGLDFIDYAGYWHINADVQKLYEEGKFTAQDRNALRGNIITAHLSVDKGLLIHDGKGGFRWKDGVGPFSDEWIRLVDDVFGISSPQSKNQEKKTDLNTAGLLLYNLHR